MILPISFSSGPFFYRDGYVVVTGKTEVGVKSQYGWEFYILDVSFKNFEGGWCVHSREAIVFVIL